MTTMTPEEQTEVATEPTLPAELWLLWEGKRFVVSVDDAKRGETFLAATSEESALAACEHQLNAYDCPCRPVRVK